MLVAVAAMASVSCQKQEIAAPETISTTLTLNAEVEQTKTYLGENNTVLWGENESVMLYLQDGAVKTVDGDEVPVPKFIESTKTSEFNGNPSAQFSFTFDGDNTIVPASEYMLGGVYPASAAINDNKNVSQYKISLPATQTQVEGKYDPSAYIMVLKPTVVTEVPTEYTASFRRAVALNKITLTNVKEDINSVEITVPENKYLAGRRYINLTTGDSGEIYYDKSNKVTVNGSFTGNTIDVWFTSWGVELAEGDELTIKMTSATKTYTRTIAARSEGIKFEEGYLNKLAVNMSSATVETLDNLSGAYLIVNTDLTRAAQAWAGGNNLPGFELNVIDGVVYESEGIDNCKMTIEQQADGKYTIKDANGLYLYAASSSSNHLKGQSEASNWTIEQDGDKYILTSSAQTSRNIMQYNDQNNIFSCYSSGQKDITLYKYSDIKPDTTPSVSVEETTSPSIGAEGGDLTFTCTIKNLDGKTLEVDEESDYLTWSVVEKVVTITVAANETAESRTLNATIKCGSVEVPVTITQAGKTPEGTPTSKVDKLVAELFTATSTTYTDFSGVSVTSSAVYAGNSSKSNNAGIQLRSNNSNSGIVTTTSGGKVKKITVVWESSTSSGRTLDIYGKNTAYSAATNLYNSSTQGTKLGSITCGTSTELEISGDYEYIGLRSASGAMYLTSIEITWETGSGSGSGENPGEGGGETPDPTPDPEPDQPGEGGGGGSDEGDVKTYTLTIDANSFNTTSYAANNNEKTSTATATDGSTIEVKWTSNQVMKQSSAMQWQKNKGYIYNSTDLGTITDISITSSAGSFTKYIGTSSNPTSNGSGGYFQIKVGNATGTSSKIVVTFQK